MTLSEKAEEILERLWLERTEKNHRQVTLQTLGETPESSQMQELLGAGLVALREDKRISLTPEGEKSGEHVVRHHRLAERLLADVLDMPGAAGDKIACHFEHILKRGLDERICTLLGHPRFCPHGLPIPPGPCCQEKRNASIRIVAALSEMEEGERGAIAYLHTKERDRLERLLALGVLPGQPVTLLQRFPSFVFRVGETQIAVDSDLAAHIYVRLGGQLPARRRWRRRGLFLR